jgi:hypothetical protein
MLLVSYFFIINLVNTDGVGSHLVAPKLRGPKNALFQRGKLQQTPQIEEPYLKSCGNPRTQVCNQASWNCLKEPGSQEIHLYCLQ